jgi:hypothetical protein
MIFAKLEAIWGMSAKTSDFWGTAIVIGCVAEPPLVAKERRVLLRLVGRLPPLNGATGHGR